MNTPEQIAREYAADFGGRTYSSYEGAKESLTRVIMEAMARAVADQRAAVLELWGKHLGPHKCAVDGVDQFLKELEAWMTEETK